MPSLLVLGTSPASKSAEKGPGPLEPDRALSHGPMPAAALCCHLICHAHLVCAGLVYVSRPVPHGISRALRTSSVYPSSPFTSLLTPCPQTDLSRCSCMVSPTHTNLSLHILLLDLRQPPPAQSTPEACYVHKLYASSVALHCTQCSCSTSTSTSYHNELSFHSNRVTQNNRTISVNFLFDCLRHALSSQFKPNRQQKQNNNLQASLLSQLHNNPPEYGKYSRDDNSKLLRVEKEPQPQPQPYSQLPASSPIPQRCQCFALSESDSDRTGWGHTSSSTALPFAHVLCTCT